MSLATPSVSRTLASSKTSCITSDMEATFSITSCGTAVSSSRAGIWPTIQVFRQATSMCSAVCIATSASDDDVFCSVVAQTQRDDLVQQLCIAESAVCCRISEVLIFGNLRVGIRFQQVALAVRRHSIIEPRVAAETQMPVNTFRQQKDIPLQFGREIGRFGNEADFFLIIRVPFETACRDIQCPFRKVVDHQFPGRIRLQLPIADNPDINFAPSDVLFCDGVT